MDWKLKLSEGQELGYFQKTEHETDDANQDFVLGRYHNKCAQALLTGGKGSSLAILSVVKGITVPDFFVVSTKAFQKSLAESTDFKQTLTTLEEMPKDHPQLGELAHQLKNIVSQIEFPEEVSTLITKYYKDLCERMETPHCSVAVRSSATTEDTAEASFAGQHSTYLNQIGEKDVLESVRRCWASIFNRRAVEYRNRLNIKHEEALVAVVVQAMVEPAAAGTGFSVEIATGFNGIHVAAAYGLGEGVVSGDVTSDEWLFQPEAPYRLIKKTCGSKVVQYVRKPDGSGIDRVKVDDARAKEFCLTVQQARKVSKATKYIASAYRWLFGYEEIDTEFAFSKEKLFLLQARCVVPSVQRIFTVSPKTPSQEIILRGKYALIGAVHGKVNIIENFDDLVSGKSCIEPEDIVVAVKTGNYWNQFLKQLRGIVTVEGSPTAHPMLIGRERNIPCVIGCPNALDYLRPYNNQWVTLDGLKKSVYLGKQTLVEATREDIQHRFNVVEELTLPSDEQSKGYLLQAGRAIRDPSNADMIWVANPDHTLPPVWLQLTRESYQLRSDIILSARNSRDCLTTSMKVLDDTTLIQDGKVYDHIRPLRETMRVFDDFTLQECEEFVAQRARDSKEYLSACEKLNENPSLENWNNYAQSYRLMTAHKWLSWFFRTYLEQQMAVMARKVGCSQLHFEEMQERFQEHLGAKGEDLDRKLAAEIARIRGLVDINKDFCEQSKEVQEAIESIATSYRITKNSDITLDIPVREVWEKCKTGSQVPGIAFDDGSLFYSEEEEFVKFVKLGIEARIQHCNSHHWLMRGQFLVRELLVKLKFDWNSQTIDHLFK